MSNPNSELDQIKDHQDLETFLVVAVLAHYLVTDTVLEYYNDASLMEAVFFTPAISECFTRLCLTIPLDITFKLGTAILISSQKKEPLPKAILDILAFMKNSVQTEYLRESIKGEVAKHEAKIKAEAIRPKSAYEKIIQKFTFTGKAGSSNN